MTDLHIDDFCHDAAVALTRLYQYFPRPQALYVSDIAGAEERDEVGLYSKRHMSCLHTLLWLADESFFRFTALIYEEGVEQAVLTHSAFVLLSSLSVPEALQTPNLPSNTWISHIRDALREQNSARCYALVHQLLTEALTLPKATSRHEPTVTPAPAIEKANLPTIEEMFASL